MHTAYDEHDWSALCALTTTLAPEFGGRPAAFREAVRRNPHLNSTPPSTVAIGTAQLENSPLAKACERLIAAASDSDVVKGAEARAKAFKASRQ